MTPVHRMLVEVVIMLSDEEKKPWPEELPPGDCQKGPNPEQLAEVLRFSLGTLIGVAEKIKKVDALRESKETEVRPANLLNEDFSRPWWSVILGLGGLYLGYRIFRKD